MNKQHFRFSLFLLMCLSVPLTGAAQIDISVASSSNRPAVGDGVEFSINIAGGSNVAGYDFRLTFSPTGLEFIDIADANYLGDDERTLPFSPTELAPVTDPDYSVSDVYTISPIVGDGSVRFAAFALTGTGKGDGPLAVARFKVLTETETTIGLERVVIGNRTAHPIEIGSVTGATITPTAAAAGNVEFRLSIPAGIGLIHVPLKVNAIGGVARTITSISDLYNILGGQSNVIYLFTRDSQTQEWIGYLKPSDRGTSKDKELTDDMGIITNLINEVTLRLRGSSLGTNGNSTIRLNPGINLVGVPLGDSRITHVSDLFSLEGIANNVLLIISQDDNGVVKPINPTGSSGDIAITGGQSFIMTSLRKDTVVISGDAWANLPEVGGAPPIIRRGIKVDDVTPILALRGSIADEGRRLTKTNFRVIAKNRSTGRTVTAVTQGEYNSHSDPLGLDGVGYQLADVDLQTGRAAMIGDILEVSAQSSNPLIGVEPLQYTVTAEDVRQGWIQLSALRAYEIPAETALLRNYPNPFNPETWIPYQLAHAAGVTLTIYDTEGMLVRRLDLGYQQAGYYTNRTRAAYWDGRNHLGESVGSGIYFYHLRAGDYSTTRKMVILK